MTRTLTAICAVMAVALAGCAATGTSDTTSSSGSAVVSPTIAASSSVVVAASATPSTQPSVVTPTAPTTQEQPATTVSAPARPTDRSSAVPTVADGSAGWYDTWGWVSPQTAERALAAGIAAGKDVRDELRCGTACGESPTAAEIQAQYILDHPDNPNANLEAYEAAAAACPGYFIRGNCYADAAAAAAAGEGE